MYSSANLPRADGHGFMVMQQHDSEELLRRNGRHAVKSLNVLFVTNMYPDSVCLSSGTFVQQQAEYLRKAGHRVDVLNIGSRRSQFKYVRSIFDVVAKTRTTAYDVVHA